MSADDKCPCGADVDPVLLEVRAFFPSQPLLCTKCYEIAQREEEEKLKRDMEHAEHRRRLALLDQTVPPKILATDLGHDTFNKALYVAAHGWNPDTGKWLVIHGLPGKCKTRVVGMIAKRLILEGRHVTWTTAGKFQAAVEAIHSYTKGEEAARAEGRAKIRQWTECGVLVFDDLGKNTWSPSFESRFFELIDHRETHYLPTIITSNRPITHLIDDMSRDRGVPIIGRINDAARGWILEAK